MFSNVWQRRLLNIKNINGLSRLGSHLAQRLGSSEVVFARQFIFVEKELWFFLSRRVICNFSFYVLVEQTEVLVDAETLCFLFGLRSTFDVCYHFIILFWFCIDFKTIYFPLG